MSLGLFKTSSPEEADVQRSWRGVMYTRIQREGDQGRRQSWPRPREGRASGPFPGRARLGPGLGGAAGVGSDAGPSPGADDIWLLRPSAQVVGTLFLNRGVSSWGCCPGSQLSPVISWVQQSPWTLSHHSGSNLGCFLLSLISPRVGRKVGGNCLFRHVSCMWA